MKIALVVFRFGPSHGSLLQTYALTRTLESLGHQVTIIDRQRPIRLQNINTMIKRVVLSLSHGNLELGDFRLGEHPRQVMKPFRKFIKKNFANQYITLTTESQLNIVGSEQGFGAYIVGSDQTWRPMYVYNIYNYFLDFVPRFRKVIRLSYAASFGTSVWEYTKEQENRCKELIRQFDGVSVRESDGVDLCKKYFSIDAVHVLDPTLLLNASDYRKLIVTSKPFEKYVGFNFLDNNNAKMQLVEDVCRLMNVGKRSMNTIQQSKSRKYKLMPTIEEWIMNIDQSEIAIVDSFHATVFSIILHKNFFTIANIDRGMARFTSLLGTLGLEERLITENTHLTKQQIFAPINWNLIDAKLDELRRESINFLKKYL